MITKLPLFPTLGRILKNSFSEIYNSIGFSALISLVWAVGYFPIILVLLTTGYYVLVSLLKQVKIGEIFIIVNISMLLVSIWSAFVAGPLSTSLYGLYNVKREGYPSLKIFGNLFRKYYWRSFAVYGAFALGISLLVFNVFLSFMEKNFFFKISGIFSAYILFFVLLIQFYFAPLINMDNRFKQVYKKACLLLLDNPGLTISFFLLFAILFIPSFLVTIFLLLAYGAFMIYVTTEGFEAIYHRYEETTAEGEKNE